MEKSKNKTAIIVIIMIILLAAGLIFFLSRKGGEEKVKDITKKEFDIQSEKLSTYKLMKMIGDRNLFYLGLDEVKIEGDNLLDYLDDHEVEDLKRHFNRVITYKDGGSKLYICDDESKCSKNIKILFCNTTAGDQDIYVSHGDIDLTSDYCDNQEKS